ncbi:hypothetical protein DM01DRAFT_1381777 [Hesseltinella vesiculosa]|uniref:Uncharacterized protein n=1 Tax=Hesseltinella vesiculosa TaxID=101127 RepID=A0A1X2GNX4_9FUNG|nr:hypothetical protein DM01DRAFT_1381777 [Hesseltinella vesiculosa]
MFFPADTPRHAPDFNARHRRHLKTKYYRMIDRLGQYQAASLQTLLNEFASTVKPELLPTPEIPTPRLLTGTDIPQSRMDLLAKFCNGETLPSPPSSSSHNPNELYHGLNQDPVKLQYQQDQEAIWNQLVKGKLEEFDQQAKVVDHDHQASLAALEQGRYFNPSKPAAAQPSTATRPNPSTLPSGSAMPQTQPTDIRAYARPSAPSQPHDPRLQSQALTPNSQQPLAHTPPSTRDPRLQSQATLSSFLNQQPATFQAAARDPRLQAQTALPPQLPATLNIAASRDPRLQSQSVTVSSPPQQTATYISVIRDPRLQNQSLTSSSQSSIAGTPTTADYNRDLCLQLQAALVSASQQTTAFHAQNPHHLNSQGGVADANTQVFPNAQQPTVMDMISTLPSLSSLKDISPAMMTSLVTAWYTANAMGASSADPDTTNMEIALAFQHALLQQPQLLQDTAVPSTITPLQTTPAKRPYPSSKKEQVCASSLRSAGADAQQHGPSTSKAETSTFQEKKRTRTALDPSPQPAGPFIHPSRLKGSDIATASVLPTTEPQLGHAPLPPQMSISYRTDNPLLFKKYLTTIGKLGTIKIEKTKYFACEMRKNEKYLGETLLLGPCDLFREIARSKRGARFEFEEQKFLLTTDNSSKSTLVTMQHRRFGELRIGTLESIRAALNNPLQQTPEKIS